jgi:hypothetical protein
LRERGKSEHNSEKRGLEDASHESLSVVMRSIIAEAAVCKKIFADSHSAAGASQPHNLHVLNAAVRRV